MRILFHLSKSIKYILRICKKPMDNIKDIWFGPLPADSPYVKPFRFHFTQNGKEKNWDLLKVHDSVAIVIFNRTKNRLVLVKQFRPAVYYGMISDDEGFKYKIGEEFRPQIDFEKYPPKIGITLELCAGIIDKDKSVKQIAKEEVLEECGYDVPLDLFEEVLVYRSGVGASSALQTLYYCEVTDDMKVPGSRETYGVDDELIEVVEVSIEEMENSLKPGNKLTSPPSFLFGIMWFLAKKAPKFRK